MKMKHIIDDIGQEWKTVGYILKFNKAELDNIESCHNGSERCSEMLSKWLTGFVMCKNDKPITWKTLIEAFKDARLGELARELREILSLDV